MVPHPQLPLEWQSGKAHVGHMTDTTEQIEATLAELLKTTDELSEVVARQDAEIAVLKRRVQMLMEREAEREAQGGGVVMGDERPPHY